MFYECHHKQPDAMKPHFCNPDAHVGLRTLVHALFLTFSFSFWGSPKLKHTCALFARSRSLSRTESDIVDGHLDAWRETEKARVCVCACAYVRVRMCVCARERACALTKEEEKQEERYEEDTCHMRRRIHVI
jgi:hypothetical protein